jgi:SpoVK/Ycf46/Vps4 family AAA+-type ATPase
MQHNKDFLQWFQEHTLAVFVAAAANRPWCLKPELLRRFSEVYHVPLPNLAARRELFQVQMQRYKLLSTDYERQNLGFSPWNTTSSVSNI